MRRLATAAALAVVCTAACSSDAPSTLRPRAPEARQLAGLWWLLLAMAAVVYAVVVGLIVVALWRGHRRRLAGGDVHRRWDGPFIWFGGLVVPALILVVVGVATVRTTVGLRHAEPGALRIVVTGERWWWDVRYPDHGVVTADVLRVPAGRPLAVEVRTADVIHSFWVPQLFGKLDTIPEQRNVLHTTLDTPGTYRGECAEFCGIEHARMNFTVEVLPAADFDAWLAAAATPPPAPGDATLARGQALFEAGTCAGCHAMSGTSARGSDGPDLSDIGSRPTLGAGTVPNDPEHLAAWITDPGLLKPGVLMPPSRLAPDDLAALVAYLESRR